MRRKELKTKEQKQYQFETLLLYELIVFHTFWDTGLCRKTIPEICEIWDLDYDNSMRRYKFLRQKGWVKKEGKFIRPLVGIKTVKSTADDDEKTVESTVENRVKTVDSTVSDCKVYSETDSKTVDLTVFSIPYIEPLKNQPDVEPATAEKSAEKSVAAAANSNGHKSEFSQEECLKYVELCRAKGDPIKNPHGLAMSAYKTGAYDVFIRATLYPEETVTPQMNPDLEKSRSDALALLLDVEASDEDVAGFEKYYTPEEWAWLMNEMNELKNAASKF